MTHLKILSAGSTLHAVRTCAVLFAQASGIEIEVATDHGHNISRAVLNRGAQADIVLIPAGIADPLTAQGLLTDAVALGTVGIGGVVREGANPPDISTMKALRAALIAADAVMLTRAPTGEHLLAVIAKLGLADEVAAKLSRFDTSTKLNIDLASRSGNALGFGPETEIRAGKGVQWIGNVPDEIQIALPYVAAMLTNTNAKDAAQKFLAFLEMAQARKVFSNTGVKFSVA